MSKRKDYIDIAKGLGIICIVIGHALTKGTPLRRWVFAFHVPLFFILAGLTFAPKNSLDYIKTRFRRLMIPYYLVSIFSIAIYLVLGKYVGVSDPNQMSFVNNIASMIYGSSKFGYMKWNLPLWFVPCFFATMCIFNLIVNLMENRRWKDCKLLLISVVLLLIGYTLSNGFFIYLPFQLETSMSLLIFVVCGYLCSKVIGGGRAYRIFREVRRQLEE